MKKKNTNIRTSKNLGTSSLKLYGWNSACDEPYYEVNERLSKHE